jgi:uncharacterized membrane protein YfcA
VLGFSSLAEFLLASLIVAIGAALQGSVGFGFALMSAPILAFVDPRLVPGPLILAVTLLLVLTAIREHQSMDLTGIGWVLLGRVPGTVLAIVVLDAMTERGLTVGLGVLVLLAVGISLLKLHLPRTPPLLMIAGLISGLMGTTSGLGGPAVAVLYQHEPGDRVRSTLAGYFLIGAIMSLSALAFAGRLGRAEASLSLGLLPGIVVGFLSSRRTGAWLDRGRTRTAVLAVAAAAGVLSIARGVFPEPTPPPMTSPLPSAKLTASAPQATEAPSSAPVPKAAVSALRDWVASSHAARGPQGYEKSPEEFAKAMKGTIACGKKKCRAGREVCVHSPSEDHPSHCERIDSWLSHRTPRPTGGFPPLAGVTACDGSHNCPTGTVCCLHMLGNAEVQAVVCHASLDECETGEEACSEGTGECRTPGTRCDDYRCVRK